MKKIFIVLFLVMSSMLFSQKLEDIKKLDSIFIEFQENDFCHKLYVKNGENNFYSFCERNYGDCIVFYYKKNESKKRRISKRKMKRFENKTIDYNFLVEQRNYIDLIFKFYDKKRTFFIIERDKNNKIYIVNVWNPVVVHE